MMPSSYRVVEAVRQARYHSPRAQRPVGRKKSKSSYQRPPRGKPPRRSR